MASTLHETAPSSHRSWDYLPRCPDHRIYHKPRSDRTSQASKHNVIGTERLWRSLMHTSQWGMIPESGGMARLTLSDHDKAVRDYFVSEAVTIGCEVRVDEIGNIFAILPGQNNDLPPIGMGSHLDTQPAGGRFDGILGVLGALEVLRTIKESGVQTFAPIAVINWTNEEGARFKPGCTGSAVWASHIPLSKAYNLRDSSNCSMKQELERIKYLGPVPANHVQNPLSAHFEVHIEQRRRLQDAKKKIGIVKGIQGIRWYNVSIIGERDHAGSAVQKRSDALTASARMILFIEDHAIAISANATVGTLELEKPSINTVPGNVTFSLDIRHPSESVLNDFELSIHAFMKRIKLEDEKFNCSLTRLWRSPALDFDESMVMCVRNAAEEVVPKAMTMDLLSLAGHDSALVGMRTPTCMIFVPSKDGISHAPEEFTSKDECALGVQVLHNAVLNYDANLRNLHR